MNFSTNIYNPSNRYGYVSVCTDSSSGACYMCQDPLVNRTIYSHAEGAHGHPLHLKCAHDIFINSSQDEHYSRQKCGICREDLSTNRNFVTRSFEDASAVLEVEDYLLEQQSLAEKQASAYGKPLTHTEPIANANALAKAHALAKAQLDPSFFTRYPFIRFALPTVIVAGIAGILLLNNKKKESPLKESKFEILIGSGLILAIAIILKKFISNKTPNNTFEIRKPIINQNKFKPKPIAVNNLVKNGLV